jgi:hypothetical protein
MATADAQRRRRDVVLVSGMPGAGKSTLAGPLAAALRLPLLSKDLIKETMHDGLNGAGRDPGTPADLAWSRGLGATAMELLWALAAQAPAVMLEANFRPRSEYERDRIAGLVADGGRLIEVATLASEVRAILTAVSPGLMPLRADLAGLGESPP